MTFATNKIMKYFSDRPVGEVVSTPDSKVEARGFDYHLGSNNIKRYIINCQEELNEVLS